jgi:predicted RNA-binding protein YlxR (DUF448 family)
MTAAEAVDDDDAPTRSCIVTREAHPRASLLRFVVAPDPALGVVPDLAGKLPGRGLWVTARRDIVALAVARNAFSRAARMPVKVDPDLADRIETMLVQRIIDWLGLARRAGAAVAGVDKARVAAERGKLHLLLVAPDAKLPPAAMFSSAPRIDLLSREQLGAAFDRDGLPLVAVTVPRWARYLETEAARLGAYRPRN